MSASRPCVWQWCRHAFLLLIMCSQVNAQSCGSGQEYGPYITWTGSNNQYCGYYVNHELPSGQSSYSAYVDACKVVCGDYIDSGELLGGGSTTCLGFSVQNWGSSSRSRCMLCYYTWNSRSSSWYDVYVPVTSTGCHDCSQGFYSGGGSGSCTACPTGKSTSNTGHSSVSQCDQCLAGRSGSSCSTRKSALMSVPPTFRTSRL